MGPPMQTTLITSASTRIALALPGVFFGCSPAPPDMPEVSNNAAVALTLAAVPLGVIRPGQSAKATATIRNPRSASMIVDRIETSCECVRVTPQSLRVEPGRSADLTILFDPNDAPDFRGELAVDVVGKGPSGQTIFQTTVSVEVRPDPSKGDAQNGR